MSTSMLTAVNNNISNLGGLDWDGDIDLDIENVTGVCDAYVIDESAKQYSGSAIFNATEDVYSNCDPRHTIHLT